MQTSAIESQPVIFDADKKQKFGVSDSGEFIDTVYREQESSKLFGKLIGRNYVQPNQKKVFTTADIVCEGYLFKKGSWMKNWKKRYFILRKDIRSLCYYASREDLTLLGTIPLDIETTLTNVKAEEADGFGHVIAMQTEHDNGSNSVTYIRFDSFEKMKAWMIDIKNEAHNMKPTDEETADWWHALFNDIESVEPKSNAMRRDGLTADAGTGKVRPASSRRPPGAASAAGGGAAGSPRTVAGGSSSSSAASTLSSPASSASPPEEGNATAKLLDDGSSGKMGGGSSSSKKTAAFNLLSEKQLKEASENSDDDSDKEESAKTQPSEKAEDKFALPGAGKNLADKVARRSGLSNLPPAFKKIKAMKPEKPYGPAPFEHPTVDRFETPRNEVAGYQLSLRLCNVCGFQDRIFVVIFGSIATSTTATPTAAGGASAVAVDSSKAHNPATAAVAAAGSGGAVVSLPGGSKWTQISRTELRTVTDKPEYGENYVNDFKIHFSIIEDLIPESCKDIKIAVYRLENEMNPREPAKATNLNMQLEIARTIISRKLFDFKSILKISMQVKIELPMDIAIPLFKESEVTLGVVKLSSHTLYQQRRQLSSAFKCSPYSEILYSFCTNSGQTLSLEQLYASRYGIAVAQGLLSLWHQERYDYMEETLQMLREEFAFAMKDQQAKLSQNLGQGESVEDKVNILFQPFKEAIDTMDEIFTSSVDNAELVLTSCENASQGKELMNNVLAPSVGGGVLRRSTWKKITSWQYCSTNLNLHLMINKHFTFSEILSHTESDSRNSLNYIPTITMGVPAAHEMKYHEGGLRKIFNDISDTDMKLQWMQALQSPTLEPLKMLFAAHPREAQILFGSKYTLMTKEDLAAVLKRKYELMKRIDICGSQALGCAVTVIKTVIMLASQHSGVRYMDILARSLKIGFLVLFESMLSTQGDELGMIEDMDLAVLWLSLVTIRLVQYPTNGAAAASKGPEGLSKIFKVPEVPIHVGQGEGVSVRRDSTGRIIVDITITTQEVAVVNEAKRSMQTFDQRPTHHLRRDINFCFDSNPIVDYAKDEVQPTVHAVAEIFGIAFTQGVNEMQTLCNLSASRDVTRQVEINYGSLSRFIEFYRNYRAALEYQLVCKTPELLDVLNHNASTAQANLIKEAAFGSSSTNRASGVAALPTAVRARRKSLRASVSNAFINNSSEGLNAAVESLKAKVLNFNDRMLDQVHEAIAASTATPHEKHVDVLLKTSALCREIGGTVAILCKSGKDRTSMGVTLENTRALVEDLGVLNGQEVCQTMRQQGVRRMNVYANTGQPMFAFNQIQRIALPSCYRPPPGSHAGNITS